MAREEFDQTGVEGVVADDKGLASCCAVVIDREFDAEAEEKSIQGEQEDQGEKACCQCDARLRHLAFVPHASQQTGSIEFDEGEEHGRRVQRVERQEQARFAEEE